MPVPTFYEVQGILLSSCVLVSCHSPLYNLPNLSNYDSEAMLHERLLSYQVKNCNDANFVKPGEPENSAVLKVVNHGCGDFIMPPLCEDPCLDPVSFASLEAWIKAGAPAD